MTTTREATNTQELVDQLESALDDTAREEDRALLTILEAWTGKLAWTRDRRHGCEPVAWRAMNVIAGLSTTYEPHPASADNVRLACCQVLTMLGETVTSNGSNGQPVDVAWDVTHAYIAAVRSAYDELGTAIDALEADAAAFVVEP